MCIFFSLHTVPRKDIEHLREDCSHIVAQGSTLTLTKARLFKYTENFTTKKWQFFTLKKFDIFHISAQNIDRGYSLEPPR